MIKAGSEPLINALQILFNNILKYGVVPQNFKEALIVILFKCNDLNAKILAL